MNLRFFSLLLLVTVGALVFRLPSLGIRPMHADESVHAIRFRQLWQQGRFVYDPNEHHGPTLSYATLPAVWITSPKTFAETTEATYRFVPVLFGVGLVLLVGLLADAVGRPAVLCAAVLTAISPAMVFYSRYYIHETLLVFCTLAMICAAWRYVGRPKFFWSIAAGTSAGLMQATKETSVLAFASMGIALVAATLCRPEPAEAKDSPPRRVSGRHLAAALVSAILVTVTLLSSFFTNARGPLDGVRTYLPWLGRAGGQSPHVHPWYSYLHMLACWRRADGPWWSEGLILALAAVGLVAAFLPGRSQRLLPDASLPFVRWLAFYSVSLALAYSIIPYKTPWCLLGFHHGLIILAGVGAVALVRMVPGLPLKALVTIVLLAASTHLAWQSYRASYKLYADPKNPYVYAQTWPDIERLASDLEQLAQAAPEGRAVQVKVLWDGPYFWPLPWHLRKFEQVEYGKHMPDHPAAPMVIASPEWDAALAEKLQATHLMTGFYGIRPNVLAQLWVRMDLWEAHLRRLGRL